MKKAFAFILILSLLLGGVFMHSVLASEPLLTTDKTAYGEDEPILVTAIGSGLDWVGIYRPEAPHSVRWVYVTDVGSGEEFDMRTVGSVNDGEPEVLPEGRYIIRLMPNDTMDLDSALAEIEITVGEVAESPVMGDASRLFIEKTEFAEGEEINISAVGSGKDWVGIYNMGEPHSIRWVYIADMGSGETFDLWANSIDNGSSPESLPAGEYIIRLMPDDTSELGRAVAWVNITVGDPANTGKPATPTAIYTLDNPTDGFAKGKLTVRIPDGDPAKHIIPYWGNGNQRLTGYTALPKFKVTGSESTYEYSANVIIPAGATQLLVYTMDAKGELCDVPCIIDLPENAAYKPLGKPILEFQSVSDIHINEGDHTHNANFKKMLEDVVANSKDSVGIFINGDLADHGNKAELDRMMEIYSTVSGAPKMYLGIGNHDFYGGTYEEKVAQFLSYAKLPDGSAVESLHYDFWLGGYHFIFLGNDAYPVDGVKTTLAPKTLRWLEETLAKDRDESRPSFVFLHQSLYNTVSGSLPNEGWNGVVNDAALRGVLKKFPEVIFFNGHSHWTLDSKGTMYIRDDKLPTIFNTASVGYLWTGYNVVGGEHLDGSQGYYVRIYEDSVMVMGRDFTTGEWIPAAQFYVPYEKATPEAPDITPDSIPESKPEDTPDTTPDTGADKPADTKPSEKKSGGLVAALIAGGVLLIGGAVAFVIFRKKK